MKEFKHKVCFSSKIKSVISKDRDVYLAKASLDQLRNLIPDINPDINYDLLPISANLFNVNLFNKNDDGVDTAFALQIYKSFINKPWNVNHKRDNNVGVILSAYITEIGTDKVLTEEQVKDRKDPFNISVGGVIWRVVNSSLADLIENSNELLDENYDKIFCSFEVGFTDLKLVKCPANSRSLAEGSIIDDPKEVNKLTSKLKAFGGTGQLDDGSRIYRLLAGEGIGLGAGITESPAAFLNAIAVPESSTSGTITNTNQTETVDFNNLISIYDTRRNLVNVLTENQNKISQSQNQDVITNKNLSPRKYMKITSIKDITDESIKEVTASALVDFVETELRSASEKYAKEKLEKEAMASELQKKHDELNKVHEQLTKDLETLKASLKSLQDEKVARENQEVFNARMSNFEDKYELSTDELAVVGSQIKDLNDEQYKKVEANLSILLKNKSKSEKKTQEVKASENKETKTETQVVEKAVETATQTTKEIAATSSIQTTSLRDKYAKAFNVDQFNITK